MQPRTNTTRGGRAEGRAIRRPHYPTVLPELRASLQQTDRCYSSSAPGGRWGSVVFVGLRMARPSPSLCRVCCRCARVVVAFYPPQTRKPDDPRFAHVSQFCVAHSQALTQADAATAAQRRTAGVAVAVERTQAAAGVEVDAAIKTALHRRCSPKRPRQRERPAHRSAAEALLARAAAAGSRDASSPALPHHSPTDDQSGATLMSPARTSCAI